VNSKEGEDMRILLVNPKIPMTFWSFRTALRFISKKSSEPPLGLLTVAAMLPAHWQLRLIDMNVTALKDRHLQWADWVFITGMHIQKDSFMAVVQRCNRLGVPVIAGGAMCTLEPEKITGVDHFVLGEAENVLPVFLNDLENGTLKKIYQADCFPGLGSSPLPKWDLLSMNKYASMSIQYSRGCPYHCDFCSITILNGHKPRTKEKEQFIAEIQSLYDTGWRGSVFIVDDNFIGNKKKLKQEVLPAMIQWSRDHRHPFKYLTEASLNLADDDKLVELMVEAGFDAAFIGIETPNEESLAECGKKHNLRVNILESVKKLHRKGLAVSGGFIVGFDSDPHTIFEKQIAFIQESGIVTAMVGLLNAMPGTKLFKRLHAENRIIKESSGDNMDCTLNFLPKMNYQKLLNGYKMILETIYAPKDFYKRVKLFLRDYQLPATSTVKLSYRNIQAFFKSLWILGIMENGRRDFWNLMFYSLFRQPKKFSLAVTYAIYGFHFRKVVSSINFQAEI
jgi:radical SAM superfamily enzyme YgiQ (UPF0313 family)